MGLKEGSTIEEAFNNASILARGISNGGAYLGYGYGYVKASGFYRQQGWIKEMDK